MNEDQDMVQAVLAKTPGAFERLVARHHKLVWHLVYRMVQHPEDARELCQDVFFRVHDRLHQYRFESALSTWIGRVAFSVATRHLQKKRLPMVEPSGNGEDDAAWEQVSDGFDLEAAFAGNEAARMLGAAIDRLPTLQRTLVTLYHLEEMGIGEIAEVTGLPEGTIKNYLFRARSRLRQQLELGMGVAA